MPSEYHIWRARESYNSVQGQMWFDGHLLMHTLEPSRHTPVHPGHPCIPAGRYLAKLTKSPHLGYVTPELQDVPGRSEIRIHVANFPRELLGCTAVGEEWSEDYVGLSKVAFKRLMELIANQDEIWVNYHDGAPPGREENSDNGGTNGRQAE